MTTQVSHDSETPAVGQQVITACAFIHKKFNGVEKVFLPRRAQTKKFLPGVFELPGGHIEFGEDLVAGLKREIREEFQTDCTVGEPFAAFTYVNEVKGSHSVEIIYFAEFNDASSVVLNPQDHSEYQWVSLAELPQVYSDQKDANDAEWVVLKKGFKILESQAV